MKNEQGITLVELLAALAIIGIIMTLITTIFINGSKASDRNATNQKLQQEGNYIVELIRKEYLKLESAPIEFEIDNINQTLKMNENIISQGYVYCYENENECEVEVSIEIDRGVNEGFLMILKQGDSHSYKIDTTFSKLR